MSTQESPIGLLGGTSNAGAGRLVGLGRLEPIEHLRFPWHEVKKVEGYWLEVDALTQPMRAHETPGAYEGGSA